MLGDWFKSSLWVHKVKDDLLEFCIQASLVPVRVQEVKQVLQSLLFLTLAQGTVDTEQVLRETIFHIGARIKQNCLTYVWDSNELAGSATVGCDVELVEDVTDSANVCAPLES